MGLAVTHEARSYLQLIETSLDLLIFKKVISEEIKSNIYKRSGIERSLKSIEFV